MTYERRARIARFLGILESQVPESADYVKRLSSHSVYIITSDGTQEDYYEFCAGLDRLRTLLQEHPNSRLNVGRICGYSSAFDLHTQTFDIGCQSFSLEELNRFAAAEKLDPI